MKFRNIKKECHDLVQSYRKKSKDKRKAPSIQIWGLQGGINVGRIHLYQKGKSKNAELHQSDYLYYDSLGMLMLILEYIDQAWKQTRRKSRSR